MSLDSPRLPRLPAARCRFGLAAAQFNGALVDALLARATATLAAAGVPASALELLRVPGSHELPWAVQRLAASGRHHCILALGVLIGGDTNHHELVGASVSHALQTVALTTGVPVINGVIVTANPAQARARCTGRIDRGAEFARAALAMAALRLPARRRPSHP